MANFFGKPRASSATCSDEEAESDIDDMGFNSGHTRRGRNLRRESSGSTKRPRTSPLATPRLARFSDDERSERASLVGENDNDPLEAALAEPEAVKGRRGRKGKNIEQAARATSTPAQTAAAEKLRKEFDTKSKDFTLEAVPLGSSCCPVA